MFIVRFHVIQFTRYSLLRRSRSQLLHTSTSFSICQELFSSFFKFLFDVLVFAPSRRQLAYISRYLIVCQALFQVFQISFVSAVFRGPSSDSWHILPFYLLFVNNALQTKREPLSGLPTVYIAKTHSASSIRPYPPSFLRYTTAKVPPLSSSRKAKKL